MQIPQILEGYVFKNHSLSLIQKDLRALNDDEVLIKNQAISLNPVDWKVIKNEQTFIGVDGMGVAISAQDSRIQIGARYAYHCDLKHDGSFADYTIVKAKALIPITQHTNNLLAAAMPCPGLSAFQAIEKIPNIFGKEVLVNGAGGMLGKILVSLLILQGAKVSTISSKIHHQALLQQGVLNCFDYSADITSSRFDVIFDTTGKADELLGLLKYYGHIVAILGRVNKNNIEAFSTCPSLHEIALGAIHSYGDDKDFSHLISNATKLYTLALENKLLLPKFEVIDFDAIPQALNSLKEGIQGIKFIATI
ncbi:alcohol dehydrogenase catalytic domain-containing protein [Helicobacter trogontum]|uniref:Alcohol dehydrogenase n=1 Tax=Helicobacter trogontum TaxID=50960 RepID=A0A4U8S9D8_9HELI|nr:hypothetical protein [Helicobacter trogontum]TLD82536.1 alcohol dehydrogenase [Helicobacter trogontum]